MSLISKEQISMMLKSIKRLLAQKADKDEVKKIQEKLDDVEQSDWNETDKDSGSYILNKPCYEEEIEYVFVDVENAPTSGQVSATLSMTCEYKLIVGEIYKVIINGVEKEIECTINNGYSCLMLNDDGNFYQGSIFQLTENIIAGWSNWKNGSSIKVIGKAKAINKLDEKYIPDTIVRENELEDVKAKSTSIFVGSSSTSATTANKSATVSSPTGASFSLKREVIVYIQFDNDSSSSTGSLTLNVNSTGAKNISLGGDNDTSIPAGFWEAGDYVGFMYTGFRWCVISKTPMPATTQKYGLVRLSDSFNSSSRNYAATSYAVTQAYNLAKAALPKSGGTITGDLILNGNPTSDLHAVTKQYVDEAVNAIDIPEVDLTPYALKTDVPSIDGFIKIDDVEAKGYQTEAQVIALIDANMPASGDEVSY